MNVTILTTLTAQKWKRQIGFGDRKVSKMGVSIKREKYLPWGKGI